MRLFFGDRIRLILRVFRDITRFPRKVRVVLVPLPFLIWISLNVVDGSPDDFMTVSWLVALRIYIYLITCRIILAQSFDVALQVLRRVPHRLVAEVVDQRENNRVREGNDQSGATRGEAQQNARRENKEEYGNEETHPDVHRYTSR